MTAVPNMRVLSNRLVPVTPNQCIIFPRTGACLNYAPMSLFLFTNRSPLTRYHFQYCESGQCRPSNTRVDATCVTRILLINYPLDNSPWSSFSAVEETILRLQITL